jgi:hypothetical protein
LEDDRVPERLWEKRLIDSCFPDNNHCHGNQRGFHVQDKDVHQVAISFEDVSAKDEQPPIDEDVAAEPEQGCHRQRSLHPFARQHLSPASPPEVEAVEIRVQLPVCSRLSSEDADVVVEEKAGVGKARLRFVRLRVCGDIR